MPRQKSRKLSKRILAFLSRRAAPVHKPRQDSGTFWQRIYLFEERISKIGSITWRLIVVSIFFAFVILFIVELRDNRLSIESFTVSADLEKSGVTAAWATTAFYFRMNELIENSLQDKLTTHNQVKLLKGEARESAQKTFAFDSFQAPEDWMEFTSQLEKSPLDMELHSGLTTRSVLRYMKGMLGIQTHSVKGSVIFSGKKWSLGLQYRQKFKTFSCSSPDSIEAIIQRGARWVLEETRPVTYSALLINEKKYLVAEAILKSNFKNAKTNQQKAEITYLLARCYGNQNNNALSNDWYAKTTVYGPDFVAGWIGWSRILHENGDYDEAIAKLEIANRLDPDEPNVLLQWGDVLKDLGNSELAVKKYDEAIALDTTYRDALFKKGVILRSRGFFIESEKLQRSILSRNSEDRQSWLELAAVYNAKLDFVNERRAIEDMISNSSVDKRTYVDAGDYYMEDDRKRSASFYYKKALAIDSTSFGTWYSIWRSGKRDSMLHVIEKRIKVGKIKLVDAIDLKMMAAIYYYSDLYEPAIRFYQQARNNRDYVPNTTDNLNLAECYFNSSQKGSGKNLLQRASTHSKNIYEVCKYADKLRENGFTETAKELIDDFVGNKNDYSYFNAVGNYWVDSDSIKANDFLSKARSRHSNDPVALYNYAYSLAVLKRDSALHYYKKSTLLDPLDRDYWDGIYDNSTKNGSEPFDLFLKENPTVAKLPRVWSMTARILFNNDENDAAIKFYKHLDTNFPRFALPCTRLGELCRISKQYDQSLSWFNSALELGNKENDIHQEIAICYAFLGHFDEAKIFCFQALNLSENDDMKGETYWTCAQVYGLAGDDNDAYQYLQKALKLKYVTSNKELEEEPFVRFSKNQRFAAVLGKFEK